MKKTTKYILGGVAVAGVGLAVYAATRPKGKVIYIASMQQVEGELGSNFKDPFAILQVSEEKAKLMEPTLKDIAADHGPILIAKPDTAGFEPLPEGSWGRGTISHGKYSVDLGPWSGDEQSAINEIAGAFESDRPTIKSVDAGE